MPMGADFYTLTENSHKQVLNVIRIYKEISGAEISRITGFQPSTILYILRILDKRGFINISRTGDSTRKGGKRPVLWKIKPGIGMMLGVEVFRNKLRYVKLDVAGILCDMVEFPVPLSVENTADVLVSNIRDMLSHEELNSRAFLGVGIGMPGLVDSHKGLLQYSALLEVKNMSLGEQLTKKLGRPVYILNDANAGALSISWYHDQLEEKLPANIVYLTYNNGSKNLGTGLIINNSLYEGISGTAGEIFDPLPDLGLLVNNAVKKYGSNHPLLTDHQLPEAISFKKLADCALSGCKLSVHVVSRICELLSEEIVRLTGLLNPNLIVLGGDITCRVELLSGYILPRIRKKTSKLLKMGFKIPGIRYSSYGEYSVAMGATAMILSMILQSQNHKTR